MKPLILALVLLAAPVAVHAQTAPAPAAPAAPAPPYGAPIRLEAAQALIERAEAAAEARGFRMAFAVVEPSGSLVAFGRMDDVQYGSIGVSQAKARSAALFRGTTAAAEARVLGGRTVSLAVDDLMPLAGGVPIIVDGRIVGALGVSGASSAEDDEIARAALGQ
ncbi:GlcG/HbpS family heme-binding protein [Brevundimonas sp.]|uniref:GlcG/HbpS family heme-binding protein n=1 Tax=Brevundimonas sp. TaxID=1871086 RepID=UPI002FCC5F16